MQGTQTTAETKRNNSTNKTTKQQRKQHETTTQTKQRNNSTTTTAQQDETTAPQTQACGIARARLPKVLVAWLPPTGMLMPRRRVSCLWNPLSALVVAWQWLASARAEGIAC